MKIITRFLALLIYGLYSAALWVQLGASYSEFDPGPYPGRVGQLQTQGTGAIACAWVMTIPLLFFAVMRLLIISPRAMAARILSWVIFFMALCIMFLQMGATHLFLQSIPASYDRGEVYVPAGMMIAQFIFSIYDLYVEIHFGPLGDNDLITPATESRHDT